MLIPTCWIELGRTVRSSDPCRFVVLGEVAGDGGLQDFPGVADVIHWNEEKGLDPLEQSSDVRAQNIVEAGEVPPSHIQAASVAGSVTRTKSCRNKVF